MDEVIVVFGRVLRNISREVEGAMVGGLVEVQGCGLGGVGSRGWFRMDPNMQSEGVTVFRVAGAHP